MCITVRSRCVLSPASGVGSNYNMGGFIYGKEMDMYGIEIGNETGVRV